MLFLPRAVRILLAREPVDLRNSIDGLASIVRDVWKENVFAGHLFAFISRRGDRAKILTWDNGGFVLYYKRLEQGRFRLPVFHEDALGAHLDATQLAMLLDGIDLSRVRRPKKWAPQVLEGDRQAPGNLIYPQRWVSARRVTSASTKSAPKRSNAKSRHSRKPSPNFSTTRKRTFDGSSPQV